MDALQLLIEGRDRRVQQIDRIRGELQRVGDLLAEAGSLVPGSRGQPVAHPLFKREVELRGELRLAEKELANCEVQAAVLTTPPAATVEVYLGANPRLAGRQCEPETSARPPSAKRYPPSPFGDELAVRQRQLQHLLALGAVIEERIERLSAEIASTGEMVSGSEKQLVANPLPRRQREFKDELKRTKRDIATCEAQIDKAERQRAADARLREHFSTRRARRRTARSRTREADNRTAERNESEECGASLS